MKSRVPALIAAFAMGSIALVAQQTTFRSSVSLLQVDVTVLDGTGAPVPGLTASDFSVKVNGRTQPVRTAAFIEASGQNAGRELDAHGVQLSREASNTASRGEPRLFVILADDLSMTALNGKGLFVAGERFLSRIPSSDLIGVATTSGLGHTINPTKDRSAVEQVLRKTFGGQFDPRTMFSDEPFVGMNEALEIDNGLQGVLLQVIQRECPDTRRAGVKRPQDLVVDSPCAEEVDRRARRTATLARRQTADQIAAYVDVINAMKPVAGIKHLVILTGGMALHNNAVDLNVVARAAATAGVQLTVMGEEPDSPPGSARYRDDRQLISWAQTMTDMAGGQFFTVIGQADRFFDRVLLASSAVYRLGVELPADVAAGADVSIETSVSKSGLTTLSTHLSAVPTTAPPAPPEERLKAAVLNGRAQFGVPLRLGTTLRRLASDTAKIEILVNAAAPSAARGPLTTMFGLVDTKGAITTGRRVVPAPAEGGDYRVAFSLPVAPGRYTLRFAAADATGEVGSVELPLDAALTSGPVPASALLLWFADASGQAQFLALEDMPPGLKALQARLDLYTDGASAEGLGVKMSLTKNGEAAPLIAGNAKLTTGRSGVTRADATFPLGALAPGAYTLRATIVTGSAIAAEVTAIIRKR